MGATLKGIISVLSKCKAGGLLLKGGVFLAGLGVAAKYLRELLPDPPVLIGIIVSLLVIALIFKLLNIKQTNSDIELAKTRKEAAMAEYNAKTAGADASRNGQGC